MVSFIQYFMPPRPQPAGGMERSGCQYVCSSVRRPKTRLRFLAKVEYQDLLMEASWYFVWGYIIMRPTGIYKNHDLMIYISRSTDFGLGQLIKVIVLSKVESQALLMVASWYFIWACISMRPAGIYKSHDLLTYISRSAELRLWPIFHDGWYFCHR